MKSLMHILFSVQTAIVLLALSLLYVSPLPAELMRLDQQLFELAGGRSDLAPTSLLQQPSWYHWVNKILWAASLCFILFLLPWPSTTVATLLAIVAVTALIIVQLGAQFRHTLWLPLGLLIQFLVVTSPIVLLWARRRRAWNNIINTRDEALLELAAHNIQQGQPDQALQRLQHCKTSLKVAELGYEVALLQEQRRAYKQATKTYQWLSSFAPKYKDVTNKAKSPLSASTRHNTEAFAATQSLLLPAEQQRQPILGRYRIERELGRGAMGVVYLGVDPKISRRVAIKTLNYQMFEPSELTELKQRFFREAEAAGRLNHPNIVTVYDVGEEPDLSFIAMDFIEGESLRDHTDGTTLLDISTVYRLVAQVADALDYAHRQNIVHRDIKPGNLLFDAGNQQVKVADFGIARIIDNSSTKTGDILGSPIYMSPEQLRGHKVDGASDIYSLGVTFYQLLTAAPPYNGDNIANLAYQILNKKFKSARERRPELPSSATRIINKAMAKDPNKRFDSPATMAQALRKALHKDFGINL